MSGWGSGTAPSWSGCEFVLVLAAMASFANGLQVRQVVPAAPADSFLMVNLQRSRLTTLFASLARSGEKRAKRGGGNGNPPPFWAAVPS